MKDYTNVPYIKLQDYFRKLDADTKADTDAHRKKREGGNASPSDTTGATV